MINTRIHDNRPRKNRKHKQHMRGYYSSLDVLNTFLGMGADRDAMNDTIIAVMHFGAGNKVTFNGITFVYQGMGEWLKPMPA